MEQSQSRVQSHSATDREDEKKMLPCRFFMNGYCHKGNRCRFYHPTGSNFSCAIKVPPLPENFILASPRAAGRLARNLSGDFQSGVPIQTISRGNSATALDRTSYSASKLLGSTSNFSNRVANCNRALHQVHSTPSYTNIDYCSGELYNGEIDEYEAQNTVFNHIDWSEFLIPGKCPPPPTLVPESNISPEKYDLGEEGHGDARTYIRDEPPEGSRTALLAGSGEGSRNNRKLTAKEELQMKVKQIAKELAEEPIQHVRSLDSFFRNYAFSEPQEYRPQGAQNFTNEVINYHNEQQKEAEASSDDMNDSFLSAKEDSGSADESI